MKHREQKLQIPKLGSGKYELQLTSIQTRDLLGLFRKTQSWDKKVTTFCFPQPCTVTQVQYTNLLQEARQSLTGVFSSDYELKEHHEESLCAGFTIRQTIGCENDGT